jgi:hypothetical protein
MTNLLRLSSSTRSPYSFSINIYVENHTIVLGFITEEISLRLGEVCNALYTLLC